ncbi:MAG: NAD+ synthase [Flavobacteriales bacterium]|nr:NAD+ synthase [Flavobacteriales bacterium]
MKIALAQLNYHIGNFAANTEKIISAIRQAKNDGAELVVFSELAVCGYPPRDFLEFSNFIDLVDEAIDKIAKESNDIGIIVGAPARNPDKKGKKLFNCAYFLNEGKVVSKHYKQLLPNYDIFDEYRYFEPAHEVECLKFKGKTIALTICEDLWNISGSYLYRRSPMEHLIQQQPDFIINIAASPFSYNQVERRKEVFDYHQKKYNLPIMYVNHVGAQTELIFDGGSQFINAKGERLKQLKYFEEELAVIDLNEESNDDSHRELDKYEKIEAALCLGVKDYFRKLGFKKACLGLSGGIDSALSLVIAVRALGAENVMPILMPSQFSSDHSIDDSIKLCENLSCEYHQIPIEDIYHSFGEKLEPLFKGLPFDLTEENLQSRIRGTLLMAYANKFNTILLNTSNKSELAVGYGTLYGDMAGGLSLIGDLYKTEVMDLSRHLNRDGEVIPQNIIDKPPSAELRPDQKDSDSLPDYEDLDAILKAYIEDRLGPAEIIASGQDEELVRRSLRLVNINEYKRHQTAPILRISEKAFGMGRRMPIVGKYLS